MQQPGVHDEALAGWRVQGTQARIALRQSLILRVGPHMVLSPLIYVRTRHNVGASFLEAKLAEQPDDEHRQWVRWMRQWHVALVLMHVLQTTSLMYYGAVSSPKVETLSQNLPHKLLDDGAALTCTLLEGTDVPENLALGQHVAHELGLVAVAHVCDLGSTLRSSLVNEPVQLGLDLRGQERVLHNAVSPAHEISLELVHVSCWLGQVREVGCLLDSTRLEHLLGDATEPRP
mmetsp:Transcript_9227/g.27307  ORF Transcript_9227/g.27307 Transcript_9227/m.27307 type:complete len:232 (-) Transcript_9227:203-898(-)